jgi:hypothetical protein
MQRIYSKELECVESLKSSKYIASEVLNVSTLEDCTIEAIVR